MKPSLLPAVVALLCTFNLAAFVFVEPKYGMVGIQVFLTSAIVLASFIVIWRFWIGSRLSRILVQITSGIAILNLLSISAATTVQKAVIVGEALFAASQLHPNHLALSGDDHYLATAGTESIIKVWDLATGKSVDEEFTGHEDVIDSIHFADEDRTVITASRDGTTRVWDAATGRQQRVLRQGNWVGDAAVSPDGRRIASSSLDDTVRVWETATGNEIHRMRGHGETGGLRTVAFTADGKRFGSWGDDLFLRVWETETGAAVSERQVYPSGFKVAEGADGANPLRGATPRRTIDNSVLSPDARRLALAFEETVTIFDADSGQELAKFGNGEARARIFALAFSPDGTRIAASGWRNPAEASADADAAPPELKHFVSVRDIASQTDLFRVPLPDNGPGPITYSSDGKYLAVGSQQDTKIHVLNATTGTELALVEGVPPWARSVCISAGAKRLACGLFDGTAILWDVQISEKEP